MKISELGLLGHETIWEAIGNESHSRYGYDTNSWKAFSRAYGDVTAERGHYIYGNELQGEFRDILEVGKKAAENRLGITIEWDSR